MKQENKILVAVVSVLVGLLLVMGVKAYSGSLTGPVIVTHADITCNSGAATTALAASTPVAGAEVTNRLGSEFDWISGSPVRIGDANISASQGSYIAAFPGANETFTGDAAIYCWGLGGDGVISVTEVTR